MIYSTVLEYSDPRPEIKVYTVDKFQISQTKFKTGDWILMEHTGEGPVNELNALHIQPTGLRECDHGIPPTVTAGDMSQFMTHTIYPGIHKRTCLQDTELWCFKSSDNTFPTNILSVKLLANSYKDITAPSKVFLIYGSITVNSKTFNAPLLLNVTTNRRLTAVTDSYMFTW
jgi:hypothetical protein